MLGQLSNAKLEDKGAYINFILKVLKVFRFRNFFPVRKVDIPENLSFLIFTDDQNLGYKIKEKAVQPLGVKRIISSKSIDFFFLLWILRIPIL